MPTHNACKTPAFEVRLHPQTALREDVDQNPVAGLDRNRACRVELKRNFLDDLHRRRFGLGKCPACGLVTFFALTNSTSPICAAS